MADASSEQTRLGGSQDRLCVLHMPAFAPRCAGPRRAAHVPATRHMFPSRGAVCHEQSMSEPASIEPVGERTDVDVIVIGGGVNGSGVAFEKQKNNGR